MQNSIQNNDLDAVCEGMIIHQDVIDRVKNELVSDEILYDLGDFFKILGDSTRIKILVALCKSSMCVCDIAALFGMSHSAISHQLRVLKQGRIVKHKKQGRVVYYSLDDEHIRGIIGDALVHICENRGENA